MKKQNSHSSSNPLMHLANQRGMAFVMTVLLLLVLGLLVTVSTQWSAMDIKRTANYTKTREAFFIADAGLQDAINHMNYDSAGNSPGAANNHFYDALNNWPATFGSGVSFENGTYTVVIEENEGTAVDTDYTVFANATGTKNGRTSRIQAMLHLPRAIGDAAILAENHVDAHGNGDITGTSGMIHSNTSVDISGSTTVTGGATSAGTTASTCDAPSGTDCDYGPQYWRDIPKIFPRDYKDYADYVFYVNVGNQGRILDQNTGIIYKGQGQSWVTETGNNDPSPNADIFDSFSFNPGQGWEQPITNVVPGDNAPNNAIIYFEQSFNAAANIGTAANPWIITILAEGDIEIGGQAYINNCTTCGPDEGIQNLFLIAEDDLKISQIDTSVVVGVMSALDQFSISGNATIEGMIISSAFTGDHEGVYDGNATGPKSYSSSDSNVVQSTDNQVGGNISINYNGAITLPVTENKVRILTWKELAPNESFN